MMVIIDNGHGNNTKGKRSPDGRFREYAWTREAAKALKSELNVRGIEAHLLVPEQYDVSLKERVRRVKAICAIKGTANCILVSLHNNAAGKDGKWHNATGWTGWVSLTNASAKSKRLAQLLYVEAIKANLQGNRSVPASKYWCGNYAICRDTPCPAVLTENLFQDNWDEVGYLLSDEGISTLVKLHLNGIINYIAEQG